METYSLIPKDDIKIKDCRVSPINLVKIEMLIEWLNGLKVIEHGDITGHFELVMHLRSLIYQYNEQEKRK